MSRIFAAFLLIVVLAIGGSAIAATAYQAGLTTAIAQIPADSATVITPIVVAGNGFGFPGFGFLGFLGSIFFLILVFGLLRAIFGGGRGHGHGWGPGGPWGSDATGGPGGPGTNGWGGGRERFRGTFEEWHREAHGTTVQTDAPPDGAPLTGPA